MPSFPFSPSTSSRNKLQPQGFQDNWFERVLYTTFAPSAPPDLETANFATRERWRRGRSVAVALFCHATVIAAVIPVVISGAQPALRLLIPIYIALLITSFVLNRRGHYWLAGFLCVACFEMVVITDVWTLPNGLDLFYLPMFDVLLQADLIAACVFGWLGALIVVAVNITFVAVTLMWGHHTAAIETMIAMGLGYDAFLRPASLHFMGTVITLLAMRSLQNANRQADEASEEVKFRREMARNDQAQRQQKTALEREIALVSEVLTRYTKGDRTARISLHAGTLLWTLSGYINNLLIRMTQLERQAEPAIRTQAAAHALLEVVRQAKASGRTLSLEQLPAIDSPVIQTLAQELMITSASVQDGTQIPSSVLPGNGRTQRERESFSS